MSVMPAAASAAHEAEGAGQGARVVFCLYCPEEAPVKQKMMYSTAKAAVRTLRPAPHTLPPYVLNRKITYSKGDGSGNSGR